MQNLNQFLFSVLQFYERKVIPAVFSLFSPLFANSAWTWSTLKTFSPQNVFLELRMQMWQPCRKNFVQSPNKIVKFWCFKKSWKCSSRLVEMSFANANFCLILYTLWKEWAFLHFFSHFFLKPFLTYRRRRMSERFCASCLSSIQSVPNLKLDARIIKIKIKTYWVYAESVKKTWTLYPLCQNTESPMFSFFFAIRK